MGVMGCDRAGCDNIMCRRLSRKYGYICEDCFKELIALGPTADIAAFMGTEVCREDLEAWHRAAHARADALFPSIEEPS